jgi:hypothetical protein
MQANSQGWHTNGMPGVQFYVASETDADISW